MALADRENRHAETFCERQPIHVNVPKSAPNDSEVPDVIHIRHHNIEKVEHLFHLPIVLIIIERPEGRKIRELKSARKEFRGGSNRNSVSLTRAHKVLEF
jgi:hypothetical protein